MADLLAQAQAQLQNAFSDALSTPQDWSKDYHYPGEQPLAPTRPDATQPSTDWLGANNPLSKGISNASNWMQNATQKVSPWWASLSGGDVIAIAIGVLLIAAGVFSFKQSQVIIERAGKIAAKGAAIAA